MKVVAFGHKKRVGKDTCAKFLTSLIRTKTNIKHVKTVSFAGPLKETAYSLYSWAGLREADFYELEANEHLREAVLPAIGKTPRQIWIELGNKCREIYERTWLDALFKNPQNQCDVMIVKDLRFLNEALELVNEYQATLAKVNRPGMPIGTDKAEIDLNDFNGWNFELENDSNMENLFKQVEKLFESLKL